MNMENPTDHSEQPKQEFVPVTSIDFSEVRRGSEFNVTIAASLKPEATRIPIHIKVVGITKQGLRVEVEGFSGKPFSAVMPGTFRGIPSDYFDHHKGPFPHPTGVDEGRMEVANQVIDNKLHFRTIKDLESGEYQGPSMVSGPIVDMAFKR